MATPNFPTIQRMVADLYPGAGWKDRVYNHMSHEQVCAIYHSALQRGQFDKKRKKSIKEAIKDSKNWVQMTIFDWMRKEDGK